jgi:hypothetical protein
MALRTTGGAVVVTIILSAFAHAQDGKPVYIRNNDGMLVRAPRLLNPGDVPSTSALYGITVVESAEGNSAIVSATSRGSLLQVGDRIDEVQLPGVKDRERHGMNSNYWTYQVWTASDFYRLAAQCVETCLVRLRTIESTRYEHWTGPRAFAYLPVGTGKGFGAELDEASGTVAKYVDLRTGERFSPPSSVVFGR